MAADPHMLLAAASLVPGLGSLAAAMDMALYLYEGDSFNAALAAAALIPGGAMLAIGVGKGARALFNLARSGAKDLGAAVKASRVFRGLAGGARAVSRFVGSVRTRISKWVGKADDVGRHADDVGSFRRTVTPWQRRAYQRSDIDWQLRRPQGVPMAGETNLTAASRGYAPGRMRADGRWDDVVLHHIGQDPRGAIAEVCRSTHGAFGHGMVPPGNWRLANPEWARAWNRETSAYWRWRAGVYNPPPTSRLLLPGD